MTHPSQLATVNSEKIVNFETELKHQVGKVKFGRAMPTVQDSIKDQTQLFQMKEILSPKSYYKNRFDLGRKNESHIKQTWDKLFPSKGLWRKHSIDDEPRVSI